MELENLENIALSDERIFHSYKIEALTRFMMDEGVKPEVTLAHTGLSIETLSLLETRVSIRQLSTVYKNIIEQQTKPGIALRLGQRMCISNYGMYGYALISGSTLRKVLLFAIRYHKLATPTTVMALKEYDDYASISFTDALGVKELRVFNLEFHLSLSSALLRDMLGHTFKYESVQLEYEAPQHEALYQEILECPAYFGAARTEFRFNKDLLDKPLPKSNHITESMAQEICDVLLKQQRQHDELPRKIFKLLIQDPGNMPSSESVASTLAMTARTLRRKLESQGTSYQAIVDEVRKELSIKFLRDTNMTIEDIAEQVGFNDTANFRNAFKRWTNKTPGMYRP